MSLRIAALIGLVAWSGSACGCTPSAPELEGFFSGGFAGYECPPASGPSGSCGDPDCGVTCLANTTCDPAQPMCPTGYECDAATDPAYCLPAKLCDSSAGCDGEYCATGNISQGICAPVDPAPVPCGADGTCAWPFWCGGDVCELFCIDEECPTGWTCLENRCNPM